MGNFEKLSVLVIVVIIVMILVVALYTWSDSSDPDKGLNSSSGSDSFAQVGPTRPETNGGGAAATDPGWVPTAWEDEEEDDSGGTEVEENNGADDETAPPAPPIPPLPPTPAGSDSPGVAPGPGVPGTEPGPGANETWTYTIKSGDTLSQVSQDRLGTFRRLNEILELNPGLDPLRIRAGDKIKMPPRGRASSIRATPGASPGVPPPTGNGSIKLGDWYVVQHGDRMESIAKRAYGTIDRWPELWARNLSVVKDPDDVQAGTRIFVPR